MNKNSWALVVVCLLFVVSLIMNHTTNQKVDDLQQQVKQESVKTNFSLATIAGNNQPFDSCFFDKDTAFFYKKGIFVGKSVTSSKQQTKFFGF